MFIAIQWTFRDSGSLLSLHSSHLGVLVHVGERFPALYILHDALLKDSIVYRSLHFCLFPSKFETQVHELYFKPGRASEHFFPRWQLAFRTTPKWPDRSVKLRSLNNSWGWHKTIFSTESCSHPTKMNASQQKKCHGVKTYAHFFSYGQ